MKSQNIHRYDHNNHGAAADPISQDTGITLDNPLDKKDPGENAAGPDADEKIHLRKDKIHSNFVKASFP